MKVRIKRVRDGYTLNYLTLGKEYDFDPEPQNGGWIRDDNDDRTYILMKSCAHIGGGDWEIVEEKPVESKPAEEPCINPPFDIAPFNLWVEGRIVELTACIHREVSEGIYNDGRITELQQLMDMRKLEFYNKYPPFEGFNSQEIKYADKQT